MMSGSRYLYKERDGREQTWGHSPAIAQILPTHFLSVPSGFWKPDANPINEILESYEADEDSAQGGAPGWHRG